jgi:hypothetical protein
VKHLVAWVGWWLALFWLWLLLVGQWNREQLVAAAIAAAIAASVAELARVRTNFGAPISRRVLADVPRALGMVVVDFGILAWALLASVVRRRIARGRFISRGSWAASDAGPRAWAVLVASYSPNAYVVDVDPDAQQVLLHDLIPNRRSESPV